MGPTTWEFILRLALAALFGGIIGVERERRLKGAGIRTHLIVCFASCMMMLVSARKGSPACPPPPDCGPRWASG